MISIKEKYNKYRKNFKNVMAAPKILKVVISTGTGSAKDDNRKTSIEKSFIAIAGQKPKVNKAKKSIATFKLRQGMPVGYTATLRGQRMHDFLEKLINVSIPRVRDFRGLNSKIIDDNGSMTISFKEHIVFPEAGEEDVKSSFGLGVTIVSSAKKRGEAQELFKLLGFPFKK
ncbi:MAG: large subunit ribosomal protein L5 [Parcubacteria group bacterium Athens0714_24]|nr:MAG: large subunit ribosomal protein L5 [Parcubacteria group bacterium Athens0714_24]